MTLKLWAAIGALLAAPLAAQAQPTQRAPDPADPRAAVAAPVYESVIAPPPRDEAAPTPDKRWRAANEAVAGASSHEHGQAAPASTDHGKHHHAEGKKQ